MEKWDMVWFALSLFVGLFGGYVAKKLKLPAAGLVGSMILVTIFNILFSRAYFPRDLRFYMKVAAGIYVGTGIKLKNILDLKSDVKSVIVVAPLMLLLSCTLGFLIYNMSELDLVTSFLGTAPGGTQEMTIMAAEMNGSPSKVALMQVLRVFFSISVLPSILQLIIKHSKNRSIQTVQRDVQEPSDTEGRKTHWTHYVLLAVFGVALGKLFDLLNIPSGSLLGGMAAAIGLSVIKIEPKLSRNIMFGIQVFSGTCIGAGITYKDVVEITQIILPVIIMLVVQIFITIILGIIMTRLSSVDICTALYSCAPGGLSDMVLIASESNADAAKITAFHVIRVLSVVIFYPIFIRLVMGG